MTITFDAVAEQVALTLSVPPERLAPDTILRDLAADSFRLVELVVDLQEHFDAVLTQSQLRDAETLGELVSLLSSSSL